MSDNGDGTKTITCEDGTTVIVSDGTDGGSCTVVDNSDGTKTITCDDGTSVIVTDGGTTPGFDPLANYVAIHDRDAPAYDGDCVSCHVGKERAASLDPAVSPGFHARKLTSSVVTGATTNDKCLFCHPRVDLSDNRSAFSLRRNTDVTRCSLCHAAGTYQFYQAQ